MIDASSRSKTLEELPNAKLGTSVQGFKRSTINLPKVGD
jgi:hypothetical protein